MIRSLLTFTALMSCMLSPAAAEGRIDLTVCSDPTMRVYKVIEVAYTSLLSVPCYTYLSTEHRALPDAKPHSEQVAWARAMPGICESHAAQLRAGLEQSGYRCLTHIEDQSTVRARLAATSAPPIELNLVGRKRVEEISVPTVFTATPQGANPPVPARKRTDLPFKPVPTAGAGRGEKPEEK